MPTSASSGADTTTPPARSTIARIASLSYWFARQPKVRRYTLTSPLRLQRHGGARRVQREEEVEGAPLPLGALHPDAAPVSLGDEPAEREAQPRAAHARDVRVLPALELVEDDFLILRRDARTVVRHGEQHAVRVGAGAEPKLHGVTRVRERVLNEVRQHALE